MKHIIYFLVLSLCIINISLSQTRIVTKSGNKILGVVVSENSNDIIMNSLNNEELVIPINSIVSRDTLYFGIKTKSGIKFSGTITSFDKDSFEFLTQDGIKTKLKYDGIDNFYFDDSDLRKVMESKIQKYNSKSYSTISPYKLEGISQEKIAESYQKFGFAILSPAVGNIVYGYTTKKFGFQFSGGFWGKDVYGIQVGPSINLYLSENIEHNCIIAYNAQNLETKYFNSINFLWDANFSGFHLQAGMGFGSGSFSSPQLMIQIGYAYRWGTK